MGMSIFGISLNTKIKNFQNHQIFHELYIIFVFDGPTPPIILYLVCECIPSSTIVQLPVLIIQCFTMHFN